MKPLLSKIIRKPVKDLVKIKGNTGLLTNNADGLNALVNGRSSTATVIDHEGIVRTCLVGEVRFSGGRRVHNLSIVSTIASGNNMSLTLAAGDYRFTMGAGASGGVATFSGTGGATGTLTQNASSRTSVLKTITAGTFIITASVADLTQISVINVTCQANQNPSEHIDYNTIYNAGVVGVYYSNRYNGNTVASNIVTEAQGALLPTVPGILSEPQDINYAINSEDSLPWAKIEVTRVLSIDTIYPLESAPYKVIATVVPGRHGIYTPATILSGATYTTTYICKRKEYTKACLSDAGNGRYSLIVDLINGNIVGSPIGAGYVSCTFETLVNDYIAFYVTFASAFTGCGISISGVPDSGYTFDVYSALYTGDATSGIIVAGIELKNKKSSYIKTTTAAVTRATDSIKLPLVLDSNFKQTKGIVLHKVKILAASTAVNNSILSFNTGVTDFVYSNDGYIYLSDGTNTASVNISGYAINDILLICIAYNYANGLMSLHVSKNGGAWIDSVNTIYDKAFPVGANILFANGNTDSMRILYSNIKYTKKSIFQMQNWIKTKATLEAS